MSTSSTMSLPGQHIPGWLKHALVSGFVIVACWGAAITYWRVNKSAPGSGELAVCLLALPAALLAAFWAGSRVVASLRASPVPNTRAQPAETPAMPPRVPPLAILASALRAPHGTSAEELAQAIAGNKARADLDRELIDDDGFPVMTARSSDARDDMLQEEIAEWLSRNGMADLQFSDEQWRALTLASAVTSDLAMRAASELIPAEGKPPLLQLVPMLPADWPVDRRRAAIMWLEHTAVRFGWPADHITVAADSPADAGDAAPSVTFARLTQAAAAGDTPVLALVVAAASHIGQETVDQWAAAGSLFTSSHPQGLIPGEGAAGLLVADVRLAESTEGMAYVLLDRIKDVPRDTSAEDTRRPEPKLLAALAETACKRAGVGLAEVAMVVADTGHRSNCTQELMGFTSAAMPQLDGMDDVAAVGRACGTCGAVPFVAALALGRYYTLELDKPVLFASNEDAGQCCVATVRPAFMPL
jgi:hypothetical protein